MLLLVKVLAELLAVGEQFDEHRGPALPPETLAFPRIQGATAQPDYPPSTCCVRVVRLCCYWSKVDGQAIRGQGRAYLGSDALWSGMCDGKSGRMR
jgi:hypothetical protein